MDSTNRLPYELHIKVNNQQFHIDLDADLLLKKDGLFSFIIKVNEGNIVDYVVLDYDDFKELVV